MNRFKVCTLAIILLALASCAVEPVQEPAKYHFDQFQQVVRIENYRMQSWQVLDRQSLLIQASPTLWYLLILTRPNPDLPFAEAVFVSSTAGAVRAEFDTVSTPGRTSIPTPIERIYQLLGRDQVDAVRQQIRGDKALPAAAKDSD